MVFLCKERFYSKLKPREYGLLKMTRKQDQ